MTAPLPPYDSPAPGSAREAAGLPEPVTPRGLPHHGGPENPGVADLRQRFPNGVLRSHVMWGDTTVVVALDAVDAIIRHLRDETAHAYNYLVDITAVEYRDADQPMEVVWHLRSLPWQRFLRLKVELPPGSALEVPSITDLYAAADWLERECYDMFGITFSGHPDLRRILMWDTYREGHPLRKDFPLRGRFSRAEQLSQALAIDTTVGYTTSELSIAEAFADLPADMQQRLRQARTSELGGGAPDADEGTT